MTPLYAEDTGNGVNGFDSGGLDQRALKRILTDPPVLMPRPLSPDIKKETPAHSNHVMTYSGKFIGSNAISMVRGNLEIHNHQNAPMSQIDEHDRYKMTLELMDSFDKTSRTRNRHYLKKRVGTTGDWLIDNTTFKEWKRKDDKAMIWLHGSAGSGKSVLSSIVVDHLKGIVAHGPKPSRLAHYHFDSRQHNGDNTKNLVQSLIKQLYHDRIELSRQSRNTLRMTEGDLDDWIDVLKDVVQGSDYIYIVVDALDECFTNVRGYSPCDVLMELHQIGAGRLHLLLTSRDKDDEDSIGIALKELIEGNECQEISLHRHPSEVRDDIRKMVTSKVKDLCKPGRRWECLKDKNQQMIIDCLVDRANGMFLLPALHLDRLLEFKKPTWKVLEDALRELPVGLTGMYEKILSSIKEDEKDRASNVLKFLTCAKRPMRVSELREVFDPDFKEVLNPDSVLNALSGLITKSDPSLEVSYRHFPRIPKGPGLHSQRAEKLGEDAPEEMVVQFSHPTVPEFLSEREIQDKFLIKHPDVEQFVAEYCLGYLDNINWIALERAREDFSLQSDATRYPLLIYAANYWYLHAHDLLRSARNKQGSQRFLRLRRFVQDISQRLLGFPGTESVLQLRKDTSSLASKSMHQWVDETRLMIQSRSCSVDDVKDAALRGYEMIVEKLLEHGAFGGPSDKSFHPDVLAACISESYEDMISLLVGEKQPTSLLKCWAHWIEPVETRVKGKRLNCDGIGLRMIGKMHKDEFEVMDEIGRTALHMAADHGAQTIARELLDRGANIEAKDDAGRTPLLRAIKAGHKNMVLFLLRRGAEPGGSCVLRPDWIHDMARELDMTCEALGIRGQLSDYIEQTSLRIGKKEAARWRALHIAAYYAEVDIAILLLWRGQDVDIRDAQGRAPLHMAAEKGHRRMAEILLKNGAQVDIKDRSGLTPLALAAQQGDKEMVKFLVSVERTFRTDPRDDNGQTPLHQAAAHGAENGLIEFLLGAYGLNVRDRSGMTPLHLAAQNGHQSTVQCLVELAKSGSTKVDWADLVATKTGSGMTAIGLAAINSHKEIVRLLISEDANINATDRDQQSVLWHLAGRGHNEIAELLIEQTQVDLNLSDRRGFAPIHCAVANSHFKFLNLLMKHGATFDVKSEAGLTPLHLAAIFGLPGMVGILIARLANLLAADGWGFTALHQAAFLGHRSVVKTLLRGAKKKGVLDNCLNQKSNLGLTPLHLAGARGNYDVVKCLLNRARHLGSLKDYINERDNQGHTVLHLGHGEVARLLTYTSGMALDASDSRGDTVLHIAAGRGDLALVRLLLNKGARAEAKNNMGQTALITAAGSGKPEIIDSLLKKGADLASADHQGWAAAHHAAFYGHDAVLRILMKQKGFNAHATTFDGWSVTKFALFHLRKRPSSSQLYQELQKASEDLPPRQDLDYFHRAGRTDLHVAAVLGRGDLVQSLVLKHGAKTDLRDKEGNTALSLATRTGLLSCVEFLAHQDNSVVNEGTRYGLTPLHFAAAMGNKAIVKALLQHGASAEAPDSTGMTPLHMAAISGHTSILQALREKTRDMSPKSLLGWTPLHAAASLGSEAVGWTLLAMGADANSRDAMGQTPLHLASSGGFAGMALQLLRNGANINAEDNRGLTPLHSSVESVIREQDKQDKILKALLENEANANSSTYADNHTPLHSAASKGYEKMVEFLLEIPVDVNARTFKAQSPLHLAVDGGHENIVKILLKYGADIEIFDDQGQTVLHRAALKGHVGIAEAFLNNQAQTCHIDVRDCNGHTPLHLAAQEGHECIVGLLVSKGCTVSVRDCEYQTPLHLAAEKGQEQVVELLKNKN